MRKFFEWLEEWLGDALDQWRLWVIKNKIASLGKIQKDEDLSKLEWRETQMEIGFYVEVQNDIITRLQERDAHRAQQKAISH